MKKLAAVLASLALASPALAAEGDTVQDIWKSKCKSCHGETGKADTKAGKKEKIDDMTDPKWQERWTDEKMKVAISDGVMKDGKETKMKAFKEKLSEKEIDALVAHIRTLKK